MNKIPSCCNHSKTAKKCKTRDNKVYDLPRKYTRVQCLGKGKGFSTPYNNCQRFLYNPDNPNKSFDVYINKDPSNTISISYKTVSDVKNTIKKLERLYKKDKYTHKRIFQVAMILYVRLKVLKTKKQTHYKIAKEYFEFLKKRTKSKNRKSMIFDLRSF